MTRPRRFRLDSATAEEAHMLAHAAWFRCKFSHRASYLLLHWWAIGHDPAMAVRCRVCSGSGVQKLGVTRTVRACCRECNGRGTR